MNMNGLIICGYQGVGKSTLCRNGESVTDHPEVRCIDLESGNFWYDGKRPYDWFRYYANFAKHLAAQGYIVFTASHRVFRDWMCEQGIGFMTLSPSVGLKDEWIAKLEARYNTTQLEKDYKALMNAKEMYEENVKDLQREGNHYIICDIDYRMPDVVKEIVEFMKPSLEKDPKFDYINLK